MGELLQLVGSALGVLGATPAFFGHPYRGFAGLRWAVGVTVLVACARMLLLLSDGKFVDFAVLAAACTLLLWLGVGLAAAKMSDLEGKPPRQRRKAIKRAGSFGLVSMIWVGGLITVVGTALAMQDA